MRGLHSLRVYRAAEMFAVDVAILLAKTPRVPYKERDQLARSSGAISDLIADGHGHGPGLDRLRFYRMARAEAQESVNQLKKLVHKHLITERDFYPLFNRGRTIVKMLDEQIGD